MENNILIETSIQIGDIVLVLSLIVAIASLVVTQRWLRLQERQQATLHVLMLMIESEHLHRANMFLLEAENANREIRVASLSPEEHSMVVLILNYYEQICTSALDGQLDRKMVDHLRKGAISSLYSQCQIYIKECQQREGQDNLYKNLKTCAGGP